jgi:hypothetical protein
MVFCTTSPSASAFKARLDVNIQIWHFPADARDADDQIENVPDVWLNDEFSTANRRCITR